jgi:hypothetical protein
MKKGASRQPEARGKGSKQQSSIVNLTTVPATHSSYLTKRGGGHSAQGTGRDRLRETTAERINEAVVRMLAAASDETIHTILKESTDVASMIRLIAEVGVGEVAEISPFAAAYLRGAEMKKRLLEEAGGAYSTGEVATLLQISEQAVHGRLNRGKLLALSIGNDRNRFPTCQFTGDGVVPGFEEFLAACNVDDPWMRLALLLDPQPALKGKSILDALRAGRRDMAVRVAGTFGV